MEKGAWPPTTLASAIDMLPATFLAKVAELGTDLSLDVYPQ